MANAPYRDGRRSYQNGYLQNPYIDTYKRNEWQRGYDDAAATENAERNAQSERWNDLWNVPERARDEYIAMEDSFCPETVLTFTKAMIGEDA